MRYINYNDLYDIYLQVVTVSGGGIQAVMHPSKVEGILTQIQNDDYYPEIEDKITYLFFSLNKYHCFADGNKRIALAACIQFLNLNGYLYILGRFIREMENITIHVAASRISQELLKEIVTSLIYEDEYSEELKLKIIMSTC